jgi:hypothetical protein
MRSRSQLPSLALPAVAAVVVLLVLLAPRMAAAATGRTYYVAPSGSDALACSADAPATPFQTIQKALSCAANGDVVQLAPSGATPYPGVGPVGADVTIEAQPGADARTVTIDAGAGELSVPAQATVAVSGVTLSCIANDCPQTSTVVNHGNLTLSADALTGNLSISSAILNEASANTTTNVKLTVTDSTISGNAGRVGGAIQSLAGSGATGAVVLELLDSTIADNLSQGVGGGISATSPTAGSATTIVNSTITGNFAQSGGGGLYAGSHLTLDNTIVAGNSTRSGALADCYDTSSTRALDGPGGHNLLGGADGCPQLHGGVDGDLVGVPHPGLLSLAANGGPTDTVALQAASPALGAGDPVTCAEAPIGDLDQRGAPRGSQARESCDVGAYDTAGAGGAVHHIYYVAPQGSDAPSCSANSQAAPFQTIQRALSCTVDGDVVELAPSAAAPYPGAGTAAANVILRAEPGADARSVTIDAGKGGLSVSPGANVTLSGTGLRCLEPCGAPIVTDEGALTLSGDSVRGSMTGRPGILETTPASSTTAVRLAVLDSSVSDNAAPFGGGILSTAGNGASGPLGLLIADSTIAGNVAQTYGGGIAVDDPTSGSAAVIVGSTITANSAEYGGGLYADSPVALAGTVIAANTVRGGTSPDCKAAGAPAVAVADAPGGHNLIGIGEGCALMSGVDGDLVGSPAAPIAPLLAPLAYDGGATETAPPLPGSPVLGAGSALACLTQPIFDLDQRGTARHAATRDVCDIGSADSGGAAPKARAVKFRAPATVTATVGSPVHVPLKAKGTPTPAFSASGLPAGLLVLDNGDGTAVLGGAPFASTAPGSYAVTLVASDGFGTPIRQPLTVVVERLSLLPFSTHLQSGGRPLAISVQGTGFRPGATLTASDPAIAISAVKVHSPTLITAKVSAAAGLAPGGYDLAVSLPGASASCPGCLQAG